MISTLGWVGLIIKLYSSLSVSHKVATEIAHINWTSMAVFQQNFIQEIECRSDLAHAW